HHFRVTVYLVPTLPFCLVFFFNDTATTEIYTLSLHDALPILKDREPLGDIPAAEFRRKLHKLADWIADYREHIAERRIAPNDERSEEHTSELQSLAYLVCRLLLEKKKTQTIQRSPSKNTTTSD